ncbi:MAG: alpha/beta hydrolase [Alphaproteobacteria bacterium]|nr:alpha/beta hydrolase [Alphaproteobacteria bacterium]
MRRIRPLLASTALLAACTADPEASDPEPETLGLKARKSPVTVDDVDFAYFPDVSYGAGKRRVLDLFVPEGDGPFPLLLEIHGGGFTGGDEDALYGQPGTGAFLAKVLGSGVAFANIEYRLLGEHDEGVKRSLGDVQRALQFLRWHHAELRLDPARVVGSGASAGAGTALWLATHDDMADPDAEDPIARQSTRLLAAAAFETQATYDIVRWETDVFPDYGITIDAAAAFGAEQLLLDFYGMDALDDLYAEPVVSYRADVDMLGLMSSDDPPLLVDNQWIEDQLPLDVNSLFHHPDHALVLRDEALAAGLDIDAWIPKKGIEDAAAEDFATWLAAQLAR